MESSNKVYETTLENAKNITYNRRDGNTIRLVDNAIQILFSQKVCVVLDHHKMGRDRNMNLHLAKQILRRLYSEHNIEGEMLIFDKNKITIELHPEIF